MKRLIFSCGFLFLTAVAVSPIPLSAFDCDVKKDQISQILKSGVSRLNQRLDRVNASAYLSQDEKAVFKTDAEWVIAWLRDQSEIILLAEDCSELSDLVESVRIQWVPVLLKSQALHAKVMLKHIDNIPRDMEALEFAGARGFFQRAIESKSTEESHKLLRNGIFSMRVGLRALRDSGIVE